MSCKEYTETEAGWRSVIEDLPKAEAYKEIDKMLSVATGFKWEHKPTYDRLYELFKIGTEIYQKRFGEVWVPF